MGTPDTSVQLQPLPRLGRGHDPRAHGLDDGARLLDQLRVARIHPAAEIKVVLEPHAHVAAEQYRLRDPRHLHAAQREGAPHARRGQRVHHGEQVPDVRGHPVGDAGAQLDHGGGGDQAFLDQLLHEGQITGVEHFQLHFHAQVTQDASALTLVVGRGNVGAVAIAEVERTAVEGGDVGAVQSLAAQFDDVPHALLLAHEVGTGGGGVLEAAPADTDIAPHAAGEVDEHVDLALADALEGRLAMQTQLLIAGKLVAGEGAAEVVLDAASGAQIATVAEASAAQVQAAVAAAEAAFGPWSRSAPKDRAALLLRIAAALEAD